MGQKLLLLTREVDTSELSSSRNCETVTCLSNKEVSDLLCLWKSRSKLRGCSPLLPMQVSRFCSAAALPTITASIEHFSSCSPHWSTPQACLVFLQDPHFPFFLLTLHCSVSKGILPPLYVCISSQKHGFFSKAATPLTAMCNNLYPLFWHFIVLFLSGGDFVCASFKCSLSCPPFFFPSVS